MPIAGLRVLELHFHRNLFALLGSTEIFPASPWPTHWQGPLKLHHTTFRQTIPLIHSGCDFLPAAAATSAAPSLAARAAAATRLSAPSSQQSSWQPKPSPSSR